MTEKPVTRLCFTRSWANTNEVDATSCNVFSSAWTHHRIQWTAQSDLFIIHTSTVVY